MLAFCINCKQTVYSMDTETGNRESIHPMCIHMGWLICVAVEQLICKFHGSQEHILTNKRIKDAQNKACHPERDDRWFIRKLAEEWRMVMDWIYPWKKSAHHRHWGARKSQMMPIRKDCQHHEDTPSQDLGLEMPKKHTRAHGMTDTTLVGQTKSMLFVCTFIHIMEKGKQLLSSL